MPDTTKSDWGDSPPDHFTDNGTVWCEQTGSGATFTVDSGTVTCPGCGDRINLPLPTVEYRLVEGDS